LRLGALAPGPGTARLAPSQSASAGKIFSRFCNCGACRKSILCKTLNCRRQHSTWSFCSKAVIYRGPNHLSFKPERPIPELTAASTFHPASGSRRLARPLRLVRLCLSKTWIDRTALRIRVALSSLSWRGRLRR
jgi:hypothetical protein